MSWKPVMLVENISKTEFLHSNLRGAKDAKKRLDSAAAGQPADRPSPAESGMSGTDDFHPANVAAGVLKALDYCRHHQTH